MVPHKPIDPEREEQEKLDIDNLFSEDSADDLFITRSLKTLPSVEVPSAFLPNVMSQVYEYHHREKIRPAAVAWICLTLLLLCLALFSWDVADHMKDGEQPTFGAAFSYKLDQIQKARLKQLPQQPEFSFHPGKWFTVLPVSS